ncbi:Hypothetical protein F387_01523 [Wohlfahrtiimonas chitiniclastica SH04]|uniref:Uncharacterized protein n=1 Tax=Wohlfahrtiimonas chitiniclastica SH04 TaxID=1261130 RepID=L8XUY0_9GAMM|nr:hypothetical protein [Wohlfahrtiimonas chitiniclastica]ELV07717.1 Hypothetical protein F387_01523 [Wohlfahrtiimonas chitiniclastica SH04]
MSKLADLKKWFTVPEAIEKIKMTIDQAITASDLYQIAIQNQITLSVILPDIYDFDPIFHVLACDDHIEQFKKIKEKAESNLTLDELNLKECMSKFDEKYYRSYGDYYQPNMIWHIRNGEVKPSKILSALHHSALFSQALSLSSYAYIQSPDKSIIVRLDLDELPPLVVETFQPIIEREELEKFIQFLKQPHHEAFSQEDQTEKPIRANQYNNLVALIGFLLKHRDLIPTRLDDHTVIVDKLLTAFDTHTYEIYGRETLTKVIKDALRLIEERNESKK